MYIFNEEIQRNQNNSSNGSYICLKNNINFLFYSFQEITIKFTSDLKNYFPLQVFKLNYELTENTNTELE